MAENEIHKGDIGTNFVITIYDNGVPANLSSATTSNLIFKKPDGKKVTKTLSKVTTGEDGQFYYTTIDGDLDMAGAWQMQAFIQTPAGGWSSDILEFTVYPNL